MKWEVSHCTHSERIESGAFSDPRHIVNGKSPITPPSIIPPPSLPLIIFPLPSVVLWPWLKWILKWEPHLPSSTSNQYVFYPPSISMRLWKYLHQPAITSDLPCMRGYYYISVPRAKGKKSLRQCLQVWKLSWKITCHELQCISKVWWILTLQ